MMLTIAAALMITAAQPATTVAPTPAATENQGAKIKCRKLPVTGSLARFTRECRTLDEWAKLDEGNRESATRIQDRGLVVGCGSKLTGC